MIVVFLTVIAFIYVFNFICDWIEFEQNIPFVVALAWLLTVLIKLA